jgi:hypothetical protein
MESKGKKMIDKIRKMSYKEKLMLMDWLNAWYAYNKEVEQIKITVDVSEEWARANLNLEDY